MIYRFNYMQNITPANKPLNDSAKRLFRTALGSALIVTLGACQTVGQIASPLFGQVLAVGQTCTVTDWYEAGLRDGRNGEHASIFDDHAKACAGTQQRTEVLRYMEGREKGLQEYCNINNAATLGLRGNAYQDVCPANVAQEFRRRNQIGLGVYAEKQTLNRLERERISLDTQLRTSRSEAERKEISAHIFRNTRELERSRKSLNEAELALNKLSGN